MTALLFAVQPLLVMGLSTGVTLSMVTLFLGVLATAIVLQTLSQSWLRLLDHLVLARLPRLRQDRATLRETAANLNLRKKSLRLATLERKGVSTRYAQSVKQHG